MASDDKDTPFKNPGLQAIPDEETKGYIMQQTVCNYHLPLHFSNAVSVKCCSAILNSIWQLFLCSFWLQMFRIKDPKVSLDFYSRVLGMS